MIVIRLVELLDEIPMSQYELSRLIDIRQASINDMCQNKTRRLSLDSDITDVIGLKRTNE